jgi:hypothetical protein
MLSYNPQNHFSRLECVEQVCWRYTAVMHPYLHYLYSKERIRDYHRAADSHRLIDLDRPAKPRPKRREERMALWLADRLIATGETLKRRYGQVPPAPIRAFTPVIGIHRPAREHNGCGPDCVV